MRDYSRTIECNSVEYQSLINALEAAKGVSFRIGGSPMNRQGIFHIGPSKTQEVGYFQRWEETMRHLVIFSPEFLDIEANPLEKFLENYNKEK